MEYVFVLFLYAVSVKSQSQLHVKHTRPNIVGMQPLPYNIRKGELQIATFQSPSPRTKRAASLVRFFMTFVMCWLFAILMLYVNIIGKCKLHFILLQCEISPFWKLVRFWKTTCNQWMLFTQQRELSSWW